MGDSAARLDMLDSVVSDAAALGVAMCTAQNERLDGRSLEIEGRELLNFTSCSYLGLELDPRLQNGAIDAVRRYGTQFSSSRVYVSAPPYEELEELLGEIFGSPTIAAPSTTLGHLATIPTLIDERDAVIVDHQAHHSMQLACNQLRVTGTSVELLRHNRMDLLEERLSALCQQKRHVWYVADGVYSMFGDLAPFEQLQDLLERYDQFRLYVDDAHGMSWSGKNGRGVTLDRMSLHPHMALATSLNKSFAAGGGALVFPDEEQKRRVRTCGGPLLFSGPIQPPMLGAAIASARIHLSGEILDLQERLRENIDACSLSLAETTLPVLSSGKAPVFFVGVGTTRTAQHLVARLMDEGFYTNIGQFPAVPMRRAGIRFTLSLHQKPDDIRRLVDTIDACFDEVMAQEGESREDAWRAFDLDPTELRPQMEVAIRAPRSACELRLERADSIEEIPEEDWNQCLGDRGAFDWRGLGFLEGLFSGRADVENDWRFRYYRVADTTGRTVLATFFTHALWKADMLAPAAVSQRVEKLRARDPLELTARVLSMGSLLTEGNHLYLSEPPSSRTTQRAISMLLDAVREDAPDRDVDMVALRDLPGDDPTMDELLRGHGFLKLPAPDSLVARLDWNDEEELVRGLTRKFRRHQYGQVQPWNDTYDAEVVDARSRRPSADEFARFRALYCNVKASSFELNTYPLPEEAFEAMLDSPPWELLVLRPRGSASREPVAVVGCYAGPDSYVPTVIGLDYDWVESRGLYRQCLRHVMLRAKQLGAQRVLFGMGASLEKRRFGAVAANNALYVQINDPYAFDAVAQMSAER
jgi:7-keto-8-aminopelargonate synthetase-like enzyme